MGISVGQFYFSPFYAPFFYVVLFNGAQNFHFLLVKWDELIDYLAFWR